MVVGIGAPSACPGPSDSIKSLGQTEGNSVLARFYLTVECEIAGNLNVSRLME